MNAEPEIPEMDPGEERSGSGLGAAGSPRLLKRASTGLAAAALVTGCCLARGVAGVGNLLLPAMPMSWLSAVRGSRENGPLRMLSKADKGFLRNGTAAAGNPSTGDMTTRRRNEAGSAADDAADEGRRGPATAARGAPDGTGAGNGATPELVPFHFDSSRGGSGAHWAAGGAGPAAGVPAGAQAKPPVAAGAAAPIVAHRPAIPAIPGNSPGAPAKTAKLTPLASSFKLSSGGLAGAFQPAGRARKAGSQARPSGFGTREGFAAAVRGAIRGKESAGAGASRHPSLPARRAWTARTSAARPAARR